MGSYSLDGLTVEVIEGDITETDTDAIANAANDRLRMGAGVAGAIKAKGGEQVEREAVAKGPVRLGSAVATGAGALPHEYVIHGVVMGQDRKTGHDLIEAATTSCLELADELGVCSLALPAFGTGVGGFGLEECARLMIGAIADFAARRKRLERVVLVLFGLEAWEAFDAVAGERWSG